MKKNLANLLKVVVPIAIIVWLCVRVQRNHPEAFASLATGEKRWDLLIASVVIVFSAITLSFVRWHLLLRAIEIPIRLRDTLRLGFLGQLFGFVAPGQVGGDLFKAIFVAREQKDRRAAAIATIFIDRVCGLYGLLLVTSAGLWITQLADRNEQVALIAKSTYLFTGLGALGIVVVLLPGMTSSALATFATRLPFVGPIFAQLFNAIDLFRSNKPVLLLVGACSVLVHLLLAIGVYLSASSLYTEIPTLGQHLVVSPFAGVAAALPLTPGGLGSYELAMTFMYDLLSSPANQGRGVIVGLCYRFMTIVVAGVGMFFYWTHRKEVTDVMEQVKEEEAAMAAIS